MKLLQPQTEAVSSSSSPSLEQQPQQPFIQRLSTSSSTVRSSERWSALSTPATEDPAASRDGLESMTVERHGDFGTVCKWSIANFSKMKLKSLWSKYFEVGGYDCRLLVYPKGDSLSLPGYISVYLQITNPRGSSSSKWDCFASYRLTVVNSNATKSVHRESWHRFSSKKKSHGWCDFTPLAPLLDPKSGFLLDNDTVLVTCEILMLNESFSFTRDNNEMQSSSTISSVLNGTIGDVLSGKFTWKVHNFNMFKEMIRTQKITSPSFPAGECSLRISVYQSTVNGAEYLSMCLESKDTDKISIFDRTCWCLYRMSVVNQNPELEYMHKDSYGRFAADIRSGDSMSLGWNDFMKMSDFTKAESGFLVDDTAVFTTSFHVLKEHGIFSKNGSLIGSRGANGMKKSDGQVGKFTWRIENFTKLKDLLKKRKVTGLCIKSRRFQVGNRDCRLIIYPRGQSQPPCHLSLFLEVTDPLDASTDWTCFVSHRLSLVNQRMEDKSVTKDSQNRYSKSAKDWGWREFVTLASLFDQDSGFLVQDTVVFSAEVLILKETSTMQTFTDQGTEASNTGSAKDDVETVGSFTWKIENFTSFKETIETRKIFSKFFQVGGCELRIGVYESFDTICIYLESNHTVSADVDNNFWVKYRMGVVNQKNLARTVWKESSVCTKTWNNSVLQFMKVSDMLQADAGFLIRDAITFVCEILDCCPWFDFSDLEVLDSDDDQGALTTDGDELVDSEDSRAVNGGKNDIILDLLTKTGLQVTYGDNHSSPLVTLREKLFVDSGEVSSFLTGLRVYLDDPMKLKRFLLPSKLAVRSGGKVTENSKKTPSLMNLLMGVKVLQQAITDLLLDVMVECCQPPKASSRDDLSDANTDLSESIKPLESGRENGPVVAGSLFVDDRLDSRIDEGTEESAVQSSDKSIVIPDKNLCCSPICPPETSASGSAESDPLRSKTKWPNQSEELLKLIVQSLRTLDGAVSQGCPESRRMPQSAQKVAIVLDKAPKHLEPDLIALVPKLVDCSEHPLAAYSLIDRLRRPGAEPALRMPVFDAVSQLECSTDVWGRLLFESSDLLADSSDEVLAGTINFMLKAGFLCQQLPEAVRLIRLRLKDLGADVFSVVLDYLSRIVNSCENVAKSFLRGIDCEIDSGVKGLTVPSALFEVGQNGHSCERLHAVDDLAFHGSTHFTDIYLLIEMLSIPGLAVEASQTFEKAVARGVIEAQSVAMVFERRLGRSSCFDSNFGTEKFLHSGLVVEAETVEESGHAADDFASLLGLAETLAPSRDPHVKRFLKLLYTILFKMSPDESYRLGVVKRLVDRATSSTDSCKVDSDLEILAILISQEQEIVRPVLTMMRDVSELAIADRADLWHQLCACKEEVIRICDEKEDEISHLVKEKASLSQRLTETEATNDRLKSRMKAEIDRFARERKELSDRMEEFETQLDWLRSERDDEVGKLTAEKKNLQDRLRDAELQLSQLKSQKRDELKRAAKEKNVLAERLKSAEAARRRLDDELKRYATEKLNREELRRSLEEKVRQLTQMVGQTQGEKREKEERVAHCEAYIEGMEAKLQACQEYIGGLQVSLQEEMSRHAPLYGVGLEALSMKELETLSGIHEEGLRQIRILQQQKGNSRAQSPLHNLLSRSGGSSSSYAASSTSSSLMPNRVENGYRNGSVGSWFNQN